MSGDTISVLEARLEETIGANERLHQTILRMYADIQRLTAENQKLTKDAEK